MSEDQGEYAASLARFHRSIVNPHKAIDATPILKVAALPALIRGNDTNPVGEDESLVQWAKQEEKEPEHSQDNDLGVASGSARSVASEFPERSQAAVAKDDDLIPDPENEVQDGPLVAAAKSGFSAGTSLAEGKVRV